MLPESGSDSETEQPLPRSILEQDLALSSDEDEILLTGDKQNLKKNKITHLEKFLFTYHFLLII